LASELRTPYGIYRLTLAAPPESVSDGAMLTLSVERTDRIAFRCRIAPALLEAGALDDPEAILERLSSWVEREFGQTREAALKAIRTEGKLLEIVFDEERRGPF
jgi:ADP-ribosylglycohydrolase